MDVVLPYRIRNEHKFFECAFKLGFDEISVQKFLYMFHQSDVDTFPKMGDDRITVLIYGWELCEDYRLTLKDDEWELPEEIEMIIKILMPWSLDIWFSKEWDRCKLILRYGLIHCLNRARDLLMRSPDMMQINWEFLLLYNQTPWQVSYLKSLTVKKEKTLETGGQTIEMEELPATNEDLNYTKLEQFPLIVLRLVKLFDQGSIDMVKTLCMRVLAAWNKIYHTELETAGSRLPYVPPEDKRCLLLICHIYLMAVYEADDVKGYVIDNMINNIRFYYQSFQTNVSSYAMDNLSYTPARFIALTSIHLRLQKRELFDFYIWNSSESSPVNLFGVVAQAYKSYLLGNLLMELNNMNEDYFASNSALYKRLMNSYVNEREKSEIFMIGEMQKLESQRYAHNIQHCNNVSDFKSKICKGNRMSNIGNYENVDDMIDNKNDENVNKVEEAGEEEGEEREELSAKEKENELSVDPIFQNIPNNEEILYYVYDVLSKKTYRGWQFAKIVLLFKIISHELNMLETWRYHPGLTINFMLNLEKKLSQHYIDLAKIFIDYPFMEQEFWLTAFYLNPSQQSYEAVKRLGIRSNRKRNEEPTKWTSGRDSIEAKYGLLSSTIDVKEIVVLTNTDDQNADYVPLTDALHSLHLPDSVIKDILTVIFLPRNKGFSWAVEWNDLRRRCKSLMSNTSEKKRCVELTMAEANDRLKFLNIDYAKYKNRPQLDYGSIEQGYENTTGDIDNNSVESEDEEEDFEDDEDVYETQTGSTRGTKMPEEVEVVEDDNSQEDDPYLVGRRRTRARTAAAMASLLCTSEITTRRKRRLLEEEMSKEDEEKAADNEEKSNDSKSTETVVPLSPSVAIETTANPETQKRNIKECLKERPFFSNSTEGFRPLIDMWNIDKSELQTIDANCVSLLESSSILNRFSKLKSINKQNNPMSTNEEEQIDEVEMVIKHEKFVPKQEKMYEIIKQSLSSPLQGLTEIDKAKEHEEKINSEVTLEIKLQTTPEEDVRIKIEDGSVEKTDDSYKSILFQNSQPSDVEYKMEIDQEITNMTADIELIDFEDAIKTNDIPQNIVDTDMGNNNINKTSSPVTISEPQESLREMSSLDDFTNADHISGVTSHKVTHTNVPDTTDNKETSLEISLIDLNENKSVEEEKHITENSDLTSLSTLASTESKLVAEDPILTDDSFEEEYLLEEVDEKTSAEQEHLNLPDNPDNLDVLENTSVDQNSDAVPLLNTEEGDKVCEQETDTEENLPGISLSDSYEIKRTTEATSNSDTENADMDYYELKSVTDDTAAPEIEINTNLQNSLAETATTEVCLVNKNNIGTCSMDESLEDSDEITLFVEDDPTDITEYISATDEPSVGTNEADMLEVDGKENENRYKEQVDMNLQDLNSNTTAIEEVPLSNYDEAAIPQSSEEIKPVSNETPSSESGVMETLYSIDELLSDVDDGETVPEDAPSSTVYKIDIHLLSSEEIKSVADEIATCKSEPGIFLIDANDHNCGHIEESLAGESIVHKAIEVNQNIAITTDISPTELDQPDMENATCSSHSKVAAHTPLESEIRKSDETSVSKISADTSPLESETNKFDETSCSHISLDITPLQSETNQFDETSVSNIPVVLPLLESGLYTPDEISVSNISLDITPSKSEKIKSDESSVSNMSVDASPLESETIKFDETSVSHISRDMTPLESETNQFDETSASNIPVDLPLSESEICTPDETYVSNRSVGRSSLEPEKTKYDETSDNNRPVDLPPLESEIQTPDESYVSNRSVDMSSLVSEKNKYDETSDSNRPVNKSPLESEANKIDETSVSHMPRGMTPLKSETNKLDETSVSNRSVDMTPLKSDATPLESDKNMIDEISVSNRSVDMTVLESETNKLHETSVSKRSGDKSPLESNKDKFEETSVNNRAVDMSPLESEINLFDETSVSNRPVDLPPLEPDIHTLNETNISNRSEDIALLKSESNKCDETSVINRSGDMSPLESEKDKFDETSLCNRSVDIPHMESKRIQFDETPVSHISVDIVPLESGENKFDETSVSNRSVHMNLLESERNKIDDTSASNRSVDMTTLDLETNQFDDTSVSNRSRDMILLVSEKNKIDVTSASNKVVNVAPLESEKNKIDETSVSNKSVDMPPLKSEKNKFDETSASNRSVDMPSLDTEENISVTAKTPEQETENDVPAMELEDCTSAVDEQIDNSDLLSMEKDESRCEVDEIYDSKKSIDMPSLYSDESKSGTEYILSQQDAIDVPTLDLAESKNESLAPKILRNESIDSLILKEINDENDKMKELCITRPLRVLVRKLTPSDLINLRQPIVRVKRIRDVATFLEEVLPKKPRLLKKFYVDVDESSDSLMSNSSTSSMYHPSGRPRGRPPKNLAKRTMLRQNPTPDSDCDSNNSSHNVRKRRTGTPNSYSNHSNNSGKSSSRASTATSGNLVVTPRSASGLKLRISHADQKPILNRKTREPVIVVDEIIQVSSSSNDESNTMDSILEVPEDEPDPLYEEAVIELSKTR